jgi:hypothetical protein
MSSSKRETVWIPTLLPPPTNPLPPGLVTASAEPPSRSGPTDRDYLELRRHCEQLELSLDSLRRLNDTLAAELATYRAQGETDPPSPRPAFSGQTKRRDDRPQK